MSLTRLAILVGAKGRGSNMENLWGACQNGRLPAVVSVVIAPSEDSPALERAKSLGIRTACASYGDDFGPDIIRAAKDCDILCLAGFMRLVPSSVLSAFKPGHVLNIHPSLLPKFGGKGMYGIKVHEAVLDARESETGCTVHTVTENYDEGQILSQKRLQIQPNETAETLSKRVLELEHEAYIEALQSVIGKVTSPS